MNEKRVLIGLSGGINSAAVLCWFIEQGVMPLELHLYYAHFKQHSPDTAKFVIELIRYARKSLSCPVRVKITRHDLFEFFRSQKMIPHPMVSPCSRRLKIEPIAKYSFDNRIDLDLIGYVKHELKRRASGQPLGAMFEAKKVYPIGEFTDEWCFDIVKRHIGWYPEIYNIIDENGKKVFNHNNCLPCKNMTISNMEAVKRHYPDYHAEAIKLSTELSAYWGRDKDQYYSTFMRDDIGQESTCEACKF